MKAKHKPAKNLSDKDLAARYMDLIRIDVSGDEIEELEFEMRCRWLYEQGQDLTKTEDVEVDDSVQRS
jgi:hypothetical protein